jgi:apolipoprotein D and lipocalin family protein
MARTATLYTLIAGVSMALGVAHSAAQGAEAPLETVAFVDLDRYLGTWYEIASYPAWFQRGCTAVTAEYGLRDDGRISVLNSCRKGSLDGKLKRAKGRAKVADTSTNAKLKVSFFGPFWGDYWIIDLDSDYQWAVVGEPKRRYLWILSRTPVMDDALYESIVAKLAAQGYDPSRLRPTPQPGTNDHMSEPS